LSSSPVSQILLWVEGSRYRGNAPGEKGDLLFLGHYLFIALEGEDLYIFLDL